MNSFLEDAIKQVVYRDQGTCFITDSGDNVGSVCMALIIMF